MSSIFGMILGMEVFFQENFIVLLIIMLWVLPWKGYALWTAARKSDTWWFIALLVLNTLAVLDMIYIFFISKRGRDVKKEEEESK